jgi:hypothetical protein
MTEGLTSQAYGGFSGIKRDTYSARRALEEYKHTEKVGIKDAPPADNIAASSVIAPYDTKLREEVECSLPKIQAASGHTPRHNHLHLGRKNATSEENGLLNPLPESPRLVSPRRSPRRSKRGDIGNFSGSNPHAKVLEPYNPNAARNRLPIGESAGPGTRFGRRPVEHPNPITGNSTGNSPRVPQQYTTTNAATYRKPGKKGKRKGDTLTATRSVQ